ncbi:hypothetical protein GW626_20275 [Peribacillus muralis]|uniref:hypothetical protein n=1 Tax=Peribacillus muralis TaxID=264697 RepID=UPI001F4D7D95|nr:hypothetical protein [Peribacillus muralis]MCK1994218.1 hypothetical protein [Peribacillus muralis]MCK2014997.1 hypothetical protein [Peribacillus muralis]
MDNPLRLKELLIGLVDFKKQLLAFKTYMFMSDPLLLEINRYYIKSSLEGDINMNLLSNIIDSITYPDLEDFGEMCDVHVEK